jgi:type I restriction enzyme M protein
MPPGLFYASGVQANVIFFNRSTPAGSLWVYDMRSSTRFSLKANPLKRSDLDEFVALYASREGGKDPSNPHPRWRRFEQREVLETDGARLDLAWSLTEARLSHDHRGRLDEIAEAIATDLQRALAHVNRASGGE